MQAQNFFGDTCNSDTRCFNFVYKHGIKDFRIFTQSNHQQWRVCASLPQYLTSLQINPWSSVPYLRQSLVFIDNPDGISTIFSSLKVSCHLFFQGKRRRDQSSLTEECRKMIINKGVSLEYYRATGGDQVNFTVTQ